MDRCCIVALLLLPLVGVSRGATLEQCGVDCSQQTGEHFTADPVNCKNYYICFDSEEHSIYPFTCDGNTYFDVVTNNCRESNFTCTPECEKCSFNCSDTNLGKIASSVDCSVYYSCSSGEWTTCPTERPFFNGNDCQSDDKLCCTCKSYCSQSDVDNHAMIPDFYNCTNYYLCMRPGFPDELTHGTCPLGYFNSNLGDCDESTPCVQPCA